jgi:hypothetical protein
MDTTLLTQLIGPIIREFIEERSWTLDDKNAKKVLLGEVEGFLEEYFNSSKASKASKASKSDFSSETEEDRPSTKAKPKGKANGKSSKSKNEDDEESEEAVKAKPKAKPATKPKGKAASKISKSEGEEKKTSAKAKPKGKAKGKASASKSKDEDEGEAKPKKGESSGKVFIVLNSSAKTHGVVPHPSVKEEVFKILKKHGVDKVTKVNRKWDGYAIPTADLKKIEKALEGFEITKEDKESVESMPWVGETKIKPAAAKKGQKKSKSETEPSPFDLFVSTLEENTQGNLADPTYNLVFIEIPTKEGAEFVCIGQQDTQSEKDEDDVLNTISPINSDEAIQSLLEQLNEESKVEIKMLDYDLFSRCTDEELKSRLEATGMVEVPEE